MGINYITDKIYVSYDTNRSTQNRSGSPSRRQAGYRAFRSKPRMGVARSE